MADESRFSRAATRAGGYYRANTGAVLKGVVAVGGIAIVGYAVYRLTNTLNPSCTTPGSPCNSALQPYIATYNQCANFFAQYSNEFMTEDAKAGTGLTSSQEQTLSYYKNCMDSEAKPIAQTAASFNQAPLSVLATYAGEAILAAAALWGLSKIIPTLNISAIAKSGTAAASAIYNGTVRALVNAGVISPSSASAIESSVSSDATTFASDDAAFWNSLSALNIISVEEATSSIADETGALDQDFADTVNILQGLAAGQMLGQRIPVVSRPYFQPGIRRPCNCGY